MSITRRLFLRSTAAAGASLATVTAPIVVDAAQAENPELLALEPQLAAALAEMDDAQRQRQEAKDTYARLAPRLPDDLIQTGTFGAGLAEDEQDCEGRPIYPTLPGGRQDSPRKVYSSALIAQHHRINWDDPKPTRNARNMKRLHDLALEYEQGCAAARKAAGTAAAVHRWDMVEHVLRRLAWDASALTPHSLTGLIIKARCIHAFAQHNEHAAIYAALGPAKVLPSDIIAVFGAAS